MVQWIISNIIPILVTALFAVLTAVAKGIGDVVIAYFNRKKDALVAKIGADTYTQDLTFAKSAWAIVDEKFRITPTLEKTFAAKQTEFATQIKKFIPGITDDEIEQLRQAVAGEVNKGKAALTASSTTTTTTAAASTAQSESGAVASGTTGAV